MKYNTGRIRLARQTHLDRLDQRAEKRDVVLDGVAVDDIPQKYCGVDALVDLQVQTESRQVHKLLREGLVYGVPHAAQSTLFYSV